MTDILWKCTRTKKLKGDFAEKFQKRPRAQDLGPDGWQGGSD
jgi:hypothetical protein